MKYRKSKFRKPKKIGHYRGTQRNFVWNKDAHRTIIGSLFGRHRFGEVVK